MKNKLFNNGLLLLTALIWGLAFVAQSKGLESMGPLWLNAMRMILAGVVLIPVYIMFKNKESLPQNTDKKKYLKLGIIIGIACGVVLFLASTFQNFGIVGSGAGKSGFITSLYIIIVPIISIFLKDKLKLNVIISIVIALIGMYLLCVQGSIGDISVYDLYLVICALFFSIQIIIIGKYSKVVNGILLSCVQSFVCGILSLVAALIFEPFPTSGLIDGLWAIAYLGILSSGVAYTFQIIAQKNTNATIASLIMSLESVFSLIFGVIILKESFTLQEMFGCILIFGAIVLSQISFKKKGKPELE